MSLTTNPIGFANEFLLLHCSYLICFALYAFVATMFWLNCRLPRFLLQSSNEEPRNQTMTFVYFLLRNSPLCLLNKCAFKISLFLTRNGFLVLFCLSPPCFYDPQLQIKWCYIARYYVRKKHVRLGFIKDLCSLSWGTETE